MPGKALYTHHSVTQHNLQEYGSPTEACRDIAIDIGISVLETHICKLEDIRVHIIEKQDYRILLGSAIF